MRVDNRWTVYILRCSDGSYYTGITTDLVARVDRHNSGRGARYTSSRRPCVAVYWQSVVGHGAALQCERAIKKLSRAAKADLIKRMGVPEGS
jgi:putative endonuclease